MTTHKPRLVAASPLSRARGPVLELARRRRRGRVLQRLQTVEDEQRPPLADELGQPPALVDRGLCAARSPGRRRT